jgi:hypothetical protein
MTRQFSLVEIRRSPLRDVMVQAGQPAIEPGPPVPFGASAQFPRRAHSDVLSDSIPFYFIARNRVGLWVAREAEGRAGGIFLFKQSALRFAETNSAPHGCNNGPRQALGTRCRELRKSIGPLDQRSAGGSSPLHTRISACDPYATEKTKRRMGLTQANHRSW